jgi:hypothetical protein
MDFLDQEKDSLDCPERFHSLLTTVYCKHHIRARVQANGIISANDFVAQLGWTYQVPIQY